MPGRVQRSHNVMEGGVRASACAITLSARERSGLTTSKRSREQPEQVGRRGRTGGVDNLVYSIIVS